MSVAAGHVQFAMSSGLPLFAYVVSVIGSVIGSACTLRARHDDRGGARTGWLALAAMSIGGLGIWGTHVIAMLGFDTPGTPVRHDIARTAISALLSISAVFVGLVVFGVRTQFSPIRLLLGGLLIGLAVNLVHYTGIWTVRLQGRISNDSSTVWLSITIAVVAATMALLFTVLFDSLVLRAFAGMITGLAVTALHYTTMATITVDIDPTAPAPTGVRALTLLFPVLVLAVLAVAIPTYAVLMTSTWSDSDDPQSEDLPEPTVPHRPEPWTARHATHTVRQVRGVAQYTRQPTVTAQHTPRRRSSLFTEQRTGPRPRRRP